MVVVVPVVPVQIHRLIDVIHDYVDVAVVIHVTERAAPASAQVEQRAADLIGDIVKPFAFPVEIENLSLAILGFRLAVD